jgi:hypothetical protein
VGLALPGGQRRAAADPRGASNVVNGYDARLRDPVVHDGVAGVQRGDVAHVHFRGAD